MTRRNKAEKRCAAAMGFGARVWKFLGGIHLAVILLVGLGTVLAVGTVIESRHGADAARHAVYRATWFDVLMYLLAVNLTVAVLHRLPLPWKKWPFAVTHFGIVVLLSNRLVFLFWGYLGVFNHNTPTNPRIHWLNCGFQSATLSLRVGV